MKSLKDSGVQVLPDLCWCSISEPVFPTKTRALMTNSGKYAHYGPGLSGRAVRFGSLADCVESALTGRAASVFPPGFPEENPMRSIKTVHVISAHAEGEVGM